MYKSAKQFFDAANDKRVRKVVTGVATMADWPAIRENIVSQLKAQGAPESDIVVNDDEVRIGAQFWRAPKMVADETGVLTVRSADYSFVPECGRTNGKGIFGDKKGCKVEGDSLVKHYDNGMTITFTIIGE